jgi:hypothetical protein
MAKIKGQKFPLLPAGWTELKKSIFDFCPLLFDFRFVLNHPL